MLVLLLGLKWGLFAGLWLAAFLWFWSFAWYWGVIWAVPGVILTYVVVQIFMSILFAMHAAYLMRKIRRHYSDESLYGPELAEAFRDHDRMMRGTGIMNEILDEIEAKGLEGEVADRYMAEEMKRR